MHANYKIKYDNTVTYNLQGLYIYILKKKKDKVITFLKIKHNRVIIY